MPCNKCQSNLAMDNSDICENCYKGDSHESLDSILEKASLKWEEADSIANDPLILEKGEYLSDNP